MTAPLPAARLAEARAAADAYAAHPQLGFACCSAHGAADFTAELIAEVRRLQALLAEGEPDAPGVTRVRILPTSNGAWRARYRLNGKRRSSPVCETREKAVEHVARQRQRHSGVAESAASTTNTELTVQGDETP